MKKRLGSVLLMMAIVLTSFVGALTANPHPAHATSVKLTLTAAMVTNEGATGDPTRLVDEQTTAGDPKAGSGGAPTTTFFPGWSGSYPASAYIDLGQNYDLTDVYLYDYNDIANMTISAGSPSNWTPLFTDGLANYKYWSGHAVSVTTRYVRVTMSSGSATVAEIVLYGSPSGGGSDTTAPAAVTNLAAPSSTSNSVSLSWTSPGDDGATGTAASYDIRYNTAAIDASNWAASTQVSGEPAPAAVGTNQTMTVTGLSASTTYHFAMKTSDEVPNVSALSNDVSKATAAAPADTTAPAAIKDLTIAGQTGSTITLMWPATGDDGNSGQASSYEVRYRAKVKSPDTPTVTMTASDHNWSSSSIFPQTMTPKPAGQQETLTVTGLVPGRIYGFAIFAKDEAGNTSELSNSIDTMTTWDSSGNSAGLAVEAYDDMNLNVFRGRKVFSQLWIGSNDLPVETTTFGVRATGVVTPQYSQTYTFYTATSANDGVRLWVNGQLLIDTWSSGTSAERSATIALTANQPYEIRAELKALDINGYLKVSWSSPSQAKEVVKTPKLAALPDTIAPSAIAGMTATTLSASSVQLAFTTPGDDDLFLPGLSRAWGLVSAYDVRYSTAAITAGNWSSAVSANILALPQGGSDTVTVNGLRPGTTYHFAVKGVDEAGNLGAISNDVTATTSGTVDNTAPAAVANLSATNSSLQKVQLSWTAPGDDGATGTAVSYDIRYSTAAINSVNFDAASEAFGEPAPTAAGTGQTMTLGGLSPGTSYYFAMKTTDEVGNVSAISNLPSSLTTTAAPAGGYVVGGASTLDLHASLAQTGNIYYATYNTSQGSPSAASVKAAAQGATGGALVKNGTIVVAVGDVGSDLTRVIGTLPENAAYYTYWVGETTGLGTVYSSVNALQIRQKETSFTSAALGGSAYYLAYQPEGAYRDPNANYPLLVFLHGYGERGNNELYKVKTNGPPKLIAQGQEMPFIVVSPQLPSAYGKWDIPGYIDDVVKDAGKRYAIDPKRIYVTGLSIGGGGAYYYTQEHPEKVAAVIPVAGKNEGVPSFIRYDNAFRMNNVPMWAFSNAVDPTVNRGLTEEILYWMALGSVTPNPQPIFTVYQAEGHNSWDAAYGNPAIYTWLLGKTKP